MTHHQGGPDGLDRLIGELEQEILAAPDSDLLQGDEAYGVGGEVESFVVAALRSRRQRIGSAGRPRRGDVGRQRPTGDRREVVRQLLVASPRARAAAGVTDVEPLSDSEVDAILAKFNALGLTPRGRP